VFNNFSFDGSPLQHDEFKLLIEQIRVHPALPKHKELSKKFIKFIEAFQDEDSAKIYFGLKS